MRPFERGPCCMCQILCWANFAASCAEVLLLPVVEVVVLHAGLLLFRAGNALAEHVSVPAVVRSAQGKLCVRKQAAGVGGANMTRLPGLPTHEIDDVDADAHPPASLLYTLLCHGQRGLLHVAWPAAGRRENMAAFARSLFTTRPPDAVVPLNSRDAFCVRDWVLAIGLLLLWWASALDGPTSCNRRSWT